MKKILLFIALFLFFTSNKFNSTCARLNLLLTSEFNKLNDFEKKIFFSFIKNYFKTKKYEAQNYIEIIDSLVFSYKKFENCNFTTQSKLSSITKKFIMIYNKNPYDKSLFNFFINYGYLKEIIELEIILQTNNYQIPIFTTEELSLQVVQNCNNLNYYYKNIFWLIIINYILEKHALKNKNIINFVNNYIKKNYNLKNTKLIKYCLIYDLFIYLKKYNNTSNGTFQLNLEYKPIINSLLWKILNKALKENNTQPFKSIKELKIYITAHFNIESQFKDYIIGIIYRFIQAATKNSTILFTILEINDYKNEIAIIKKNF